MDAYTVFAEIYDTFMENVPYTAWCGFITEKLAAYGAKDCLLAELGCGTGSMTMLLAGAGYDMIGIDLSEDMLEQAMEKASKAGMEEQILYLCQDMCSFELYGTVGAIVSVCDSVNYITEEDRLLEVFRLVNNYLDPGGLFFFDVNTPYKYETCLGDNVFAENSDKGSFIWENAFDKETGINAYALTLYLREEDDKYRRFEEYHFQRAYAKETIERLLSQAGLELVAVYDDYTDSTPKETSERLCFLAREHLKKRSQKEKK